MDKELCNSFCNEFAFSQPAPCQIRKIANLIRSRYANCISLAGCAGNDETIAATNEKPSMKLLSFKFYPLGS